MKLLRMVYIVLLSSIISSTCFATTHQASNELTHWFNRIKFSGQINTAGFLSDHTPTTMGVIPSNVGNSPHAGDLVIYFSRLTADANLSDWFNALMNVAYEQRAPSFIRSPVGGGNVLFLDKAIITIANPTVSPIYSEIGWQFVPFGGLDNSSVIESTTQLLSLTRVVNVAVGIKHVIGLNGSIYLFKGMNNIHDGNSTEIRNMGAHVGYDQSCHNIHYQLGMGYIDNMAGALYTSSTVANNSNLGNNNAYTRAVPGLDLSASITILPFDANIKYIAALRAFSVQDVPFTQNAGATLIGAKPAAWSMNVGYLFKILNHESRLGMGYQGSKEAVALGMAPGSSCNNIGSVYGSCYAIGMPERRYFANETVTLIKGADLGIELARDTGYAISQGGSGKSATVGIMQLAASFA